MARLLRPEASLCRWRLSLSTCQPLRRSRAISRALVWRWMRRSTVLSLTYRAPAEPTI